MKKRIFSILLAVVMTAALILTAAPALAAEDTVTVYAKVPTDWTDVRAWAWDCATGDPVSQADWPGDLYMASLGNGWYSIELPGWFTGIIINASNGSLQTSDMAVEAGKDIWIDAYTDHTYPTFSYEEINVPCLHVSHDIDGYCTYCSTYTGHDYDLSYCCACGAMVIDLKSVYFKNSEELESVYIYWSSEPSIDYSKAPGVQMAYDGDNIYSCLIPTDVEYLIFNDDQDTFISVGLSDMTDERNVFDSATRQWISYSDALSPTVEDPSVDPTDPVEDPTPPVQDGNDDEKDDEEANDRVSSDGSFDPTLLLAVAGIIIVASLIVALVVIALKKNKS